MTINENQANSEESREEFLLQECHSQHFVVPQQALGIVEASGPIEQIDYNRYSIPPQFPHIQLLEERAYRLSSEWYSLRRV